MTFKRIAYTKVQVGNKILDRRNSIKVIRAFKYRSFQIGREVTINPADKFEAYRFKDLFELA